MICNDASLHELLSKRSWTSFSIICPLNQNYLFRRKFWKNIYRRVYFSQFIDWTGVLVWNDAVITPSESEFAIGIQATWTQSIFVKLGAAKIFQQSENFWKQLEFYTTWKPDLPRACAMMSQQCQRCSELEGRSKMVRRTNSFNVRVKIGRWASAPNPRLLSEILLFKALCLWPKTRSFAKQITKKHANLRHL